MNRIYVTGANGQLGGEFKRLCPDAIYLTRDQIDLNSEESIRTYFSDKKPSLIINCAAYTKVDNAETDKENAFQVNAHAPSVLASLCAKFIHFSTDYVFDGTAHAPYDEYRIAAPTGVYGHSKLLGEELVQKTNPDSVIIRTSWVYSDIGNNFVKTMIRLGKEKKILKVVGDQIGTPTYARDLARLVFENGVKNWNFNSGIYHYSNEGVASWYDFAHEIMDLMSIDCKVHPIPTSEYPTPARRPHYSVLDKTKIKNHLKIEIPHWKQSLKECLKEMRA